jgi:hypothetical protein
MRARNTAQLVVVALTIVRVDTLMALSIVGCGLATPARRTSARDSNGRTVGICEKLGQ